MDILNYGIGFTSSLICGFILYKSAKFDIQERNFIANGDIFSPSTVLKKAFIEYSNDNLLKCPENNSEYKYRTAIEGYVDCKNPIYSHINKKIPLAFIDYRRYNDFNINYGAIRQPNRWLDASEFKIVDPSDIFSTCTVSPQFNFLETCLMIKKSEVKYTSLWQKTLAILGFIRIGYTDQEYSIRADFGSYLAAFGDVIYNPQTNSLRMEKVLLLTNNLMSIIKEFNKKILVKSFICALFLFGAFFSGKKLYSRLKNYFSEKQRIPKFSNLGYLEIKDMNCIKCGNNKREIIFNPCYHLAFCKSCCEKDLKCPICNAEIHNHIEIYIS